MKPPLKAALFASFASLAFGATAQEALPDYSMTQGGFVPAPETGRVSGFGGLRGTELGPSRERGGNLKAGGGVTLRPGATSGSYAGPGGIRCRSAGGSHIRCNGQVRRVHRLPGKCRSCTSGIVLGTRPGQDR